MKTNKNLRTAMMTISTLKSEDMKYVIDAIKDRQRELNTIASLAARRTFVVGSYVKIAIAGKSTIYGTLEKINRTKCIVSETGTNNQYRVPLSMISEHLSRLEKLTNTKYLKEVK